MPVHVHMWGDGSEGVRGGVGGYRLTLSPVLQSHTPQKCCVWCAPATPSPLPHCLHQKSQWCSCVPVGRKWLEGRGEGAWEGGGEGWTEEGCHFCLYCQDWVGLKVNPQQLSPGGGGEGVGSLESRLTIPGLSCSFGEN